MNALVTRIVQPQRVLLLVNVALSAILDGTSNPLLKSAMNVRQYAKHLVQMEQQERAMIVLLLLSKPLVQALPSHALPVMSHAQQVAVVIQTKIAHQALALMDIMQ